MVSLQVPAYNEPVEVVEKTLDSLAQLNYPNFEVLVVDNNTPLQETWRPLEEFAAGWAPTFTACIWTNGRAINRARSILR